MRPRPGDVGWTVLWAWVLGYNGWALSRKCRGDDEIEMLSEACQRYLRCHRWLAEIWLALFYAHLSRKVPARFDPIHWLFIMLYRGLLRARRL